MTSHGFDRRTLLRLFGGVASAAVPRLSAAPRQRIVIAGGGIVGANLAYRLAKRGAAVTLLERTRPASGATANSFAWINSTYSKQPFAYFHLNRLGIEAWQHLDRELPGELPLRWGGSVEWHGDETRAARFREEIRHHQAWGYPAHLMDEAALRALEPRIELGPILHMKQKPAGGIVTGGGFGGSPTTETSRESAERFLKTASQVLPAFARTGVEKVTLGWRPLPQDEFPIIGFPATRRDVYITVMHSGVTLSPLVAHLAAIEILDGVDAEPLAPYRPARFNT